MYQYGKRVIAAVLCCSIGLACTACKKTSKKDGKKRVVKESDTFFESEVTELKLPVNESKEVESLYISDIDFLGDRVQVSYSVSYSGIKFFGPDETVPEGYDPDEFFFSGEAVYDLQGQLISSGKSTGSKSEEVSATTTDADGNKVLFLRTFEEDGKQECRIVFRNKAGDTVKELVPETPWKPEERIISKIRVLPDGKIILQEADSSSSPAYVFDENGKYLFVLSSVDLGLASDVFMQNGKYYAMTMPTDFMDNYTCMISEIDMKTGTIKKGEKLSAAIQSDTVVVAGDGMYVTSPQRISKVDVETGKLVEIFDWNQTDIDRGILDRISSYPVNENEFYVISQNFLADFNNQSAYLVHLKRAEKNPHAGQKILFLGGMGISSDMYKYVNRYNSDPAHSLRIETIDYLYEDSESISDNEAVAAKKRELILRFMSGDAPDILMDFSGMDNLANDSVLADLNLYIDGSNGLSRDEYFDNLFRSMETDGKLYFAPLAFQLNGFFVNTNLMDVGENWTFDDLDRAAEELPEDKMLMAKKDCKDLLMVFMGSDQSEFTDYKKKEVHFSCDSMKKILEETKKYGNTEGKSPRTVIPSSVGASENYHNIPGLDMDGIMFYKDSVDLGSLLYTGQYAMAELSVRSFTDYNFYKKVVDGKGKFVGYPSVDGKGITAMATHSLSILASSDYKDEAWEIIKSFYTEEGQTALINNKGVREYGLPMMKRVFDKMGSDSLKLINEAYDYARKDPEMGDHYHIVYFPADEGMPDELRSLVENVRYSAHVNMSAMGIIQEEAAAYFQDSRSAEDVLRNIDNRANQLVQEQ
ncbi:MAG: extracellular solute-binding protein [Clostridiales bacterium]|nr:extracellular solute-binding protein [Clostridiales bacterium]